MRARTRLVLDVGLLVALVAAFRPLWTGITVHQWLSIAIITPLLIHIIVNWDWTVRMVRTFLERLMSLSRVKLALDIALFLSAVTVMVSGFMVSPALLAPIGIRPSQPVLWHDTHVWSANAVILLLLVHAAMHWRWIYGTAGRLVRASTPTARAAAASAGRLAARSRGNATAATARPVRVGSRIGIRAAQAKAERALALRIVSVIGVTGVIAVTVFAGVGLASEIAPGSRQADGQFASAGTQTCPTTGCTASKCHASFGKKAKDFYTPANTRTKPKAKKRSTPASATRTASAATSRKTSSKRQSASSAASAAKHVAAKPVAAAKPKPVVAAAPAPKPRKLQCPATGCTASSCHATHGKSAAAYY
jgi:hypothetical protein